MHPVVIVFVKSTPSTLALTKLALVRLAPERLAKERLHPAKSTPGPGRMLHSVLSGVVAISPSLSSSCSCAFAI